MLGKNKIAPSKFKGKIEKIPLLTIIEYISFTCFLSIEQNDKTGVLFFINGKLINARINNDFHINKAKDIIKWKGGEFCYQKWTNNFEIELKHLSDILHFIELSGFNAEISFIYNSKFIKIFCSEGVIVGVEPKPKDIKSFFKGILEETKGNLRIQNTGGQTGDLKEYFSDIISENNIDTKKETVEKFSDTTLKTDLKYNNIIVNKTIIEQLFNNLQNDLKDELLEASFYSAKTGKLLYSHNTSSNQYTLFVKLHKAINNLLTNKNFNKIKDFYLLDLDDDNLLLILTFKEHHFGLVFDSSKVKLGYLFNIVRPLIINDYNKALGQKN